MKEAMARECLKLLPSHLPVVIFLLLQFSAIGQVSGKAFFNAAH